MQCDCSVQMLMFNIPIKLTMCFSMGIGICYTLNLEDLFKNKFILNFQFRCNKLYVHSLLQLRYRCIAYLTSAAAQRNILLLKLKLRQYGNAVVGAETEIRPLQLTATQLQWIMNEPLELSAPFSRLMLFL